MLLLATALVASLQVQIKVGDRERPTVVRDSISDTAGVSRRSPRRLPVTAQALATAFRDPGARTMLLSARAARMSQDSALVSYEASAYQRISAGLGFSKIGRDRLIFRTESATRVRWHRDVGAWVDLKGLRTALPGIPREGADETREEMVSEADDMAPVPYYPGQEALWIGSGMAKAQVNDREMVHPLAEGAEAYYTYASGDSMAFRLPDGKVVQLRELHVRPREPKWNVAVGSLWFDTRTGQLVRAAYRLAVPMDIWAVAKQEDPKAMDDVPVWVKPLITPMRAQVTAIAVEYGLHQGRFWLPRVRGAEGSAQVSFMRVPFKMEQSFKYASVNALDSLPTITPAGSMRLRLDTLPDSLREHVRDSIQAARRASRDSVRKGLKESVANLPQCDSTGYRLKQSEDGERRLRVAVRMPCDIASLERSPELPPSIFDEGEELFGAKEREALITEALSLGAQPEFALLGGGRPTLKWGADLMRYNRVEGFSAGAMVEQQFGGGYTGRLLGRLGIADLEPNAELTVERSNLVQTVRVTGYNRLNSANDWGSPLSFGSSLSALLFGRDEGFYYRSSGAELAYAVERGARFEWRLFGETQRTATPETDFSVGGNFEPNIDSRRATFVGTGLRVSHTKGLDPQGFRIFTDLRAEAAASDSAYGRAALDVTLTQGFGERLAGALTVAGGSSIGAVPPQRRWYLGGAHTVRGQSPDTTQSGNAFWLGRAELGYAFPVVRPAIFGDVGWVGSRDALDQVGRPLSGAGVGASIMDGLVRFDVSRGFYPRKQWRVDMYIEAKF